MIDLYTFQKHDVTARLMAGGEPFQPTMYGSKKSNIDDDGDTSWWDGFEPAYRWMINEMEHAGLSRPASDAAPVWAWAAWTDDDGKPTRSTDTLLEQQETCYPDCELLHLRVAEDRCLFTRFDQYHCVINDWPVLPMEADQWDDRKVDEYLERHWTEPREARMTEWCRSIIIDHVTPGVTAEWVQATFWTLHPSDIIDIINPAEKQQNT